MKDRYEGMEGERPTFGGGYGSLDALITNPFWAQAGRLSADEQRQYGMPPNVFGTIPGETASNYRNPEAFLNRGPLTQAWGGGAGAGNPSGATTSAAGGPNAFGTGNPLNWQNPLFGGGAGTGAGGAAADGGLGGLLGALGPKEWLALAGTIPMAVNAFGGGNDLPYGSEMERLIAELTRQAQQADPLRRALLSWAQGMVPTYARG